MADWTYLYLFADADDRVITQFQRVNGGCLGWARVVDGFIDFAEALSHHAKRHFQALHPGRRPGRGAQYRMTTTVCAVSIAWLMEQHPGKFARREIRIRSFGARPSRAQVDVAREWIRARPGAFGPRRAW